MRFVLILPILFFVHSSFSQNQIDVTTLYNLEGTATNLESEVDLEKETIIAFWATWCGPCLKELDAIHEKLADWQSEKDFNFVAITIDDKRALQRVKPMVEGRGWDFLVLSDPNQEFARLLNVPTPPYTLVLKGEEITFIKSGYKPGDEDILFEQINTTTQNNSILPKGLQVSIESNTSWYLDDEKIPLPVDTNQLRTNTYIKADYQFLNNFRATVQLESYEPQALLDYSNIYEGTDLGTYALNYSTEKVDITAGHFYDQWGSGLAFRAFEDRQLGLNTAVLGGRVEVSPNDIISITGMAGSQRLGFDTADSFLFGGNTEITAISKGGDNLSFGFSLLGKDEDAKVETTFPTESISTMISARANYTHNDFFASIEYDRKSKEALIDGVPPTQSVNWEYTFPGNAVLFNAGYAKSGFGINGTFRRLEGMSFYSERFLQADQFNQGVLNYVPALTKQQDYSLMNRYTDIPITGPIFNFDFGDGTTLNQAGEIGGQIDLFYKIKEGSSLGGKNGVNLSLNMSTLHNIDADYDYFTRSYTNEKFLGFGEKFYSDINFEIRKRFSDKQTQILTFLRQDNVELHADATVLAWEGLFQTGANQSFRVEAQHLWSDTAEKDWWGATLEYAINQNISVFASDLQNYGNDSESLQYHNYNVGTSLTRGSTRLDVLYGRRPTGLLCVGGVCRQVSAASGLHINFNTIIR